MIIMENMNNTVVSCFCRCCGKPLSDPKSISRGLGPICWKKLANPYQELIDMILDKGIREVNEYPPLSFYQKNSKRNCPSCKSLLDPLEHFKHEGGMFIKGFKERQWIFAHCPKCEIDYAFWKIRTNKVVRCLTCNIVMAPGNTFHILDKKNFPGNSQICLCPLCYKHLNQEDTKEQKTKQINKLITSFF